MEVESRVPGPVVKAKAVRHDSFSFIHKSL